MSRMDRAALNLGDQLGRGGQGVVYRVRELKVGRQQWDAVYKEYRSHVLPGVQADALARMVDLVPQLAEDDGGWLSEHTSWPATLVTAGATVCGFLMRAIPPQFQFDFQTLGASGRAPMLANFEFLLNSDDYVARIGLRISERDRLLLLAELADTLDRLHRLGIAVGDLSPKNLLFSVAPEHRCFLIDCDAMRLNGVSVLPQVETPDWEVPTGEERATAYSDAYKFGLLAIRLFARDQAARDPAALGRQFPRLGALAAASLSHAQAARPQPALWVDLLRAEALSASAIHAATTGDYPIAAATPGYAPPNPSRFPSGLPPQPPAKSRRGAATLVGGLVAAGLVIGLAFGLQHSGSNPGYSNLGSPANPAYPTYGSDQTDGSQGVPATTDAVPSTAPPTAVGAVQIDPSIAGDPRADQVAALFDNYFTGINQQDYSSVLGDYDPSGALNTNDPSQVSAFEQAVSTSNDSDFQLLGLQPGDETTPATSAQLTFQSTQDAGYGPGSDPDQTCTDWSLTYVLTQSSSGGYLIFNTTDASEQGC